MVPTPQIREFSSADRLPAEDPSGVFAEPGQEGDLPAGSERLEPSKPSGSNAGSGSAAGTGAGGNGTPVDDGKTGRGGVLGSSPLALPDPYLDPSWPSIRSPLSVERRKKQLKAAQSERERATSGDKVDEEQAGVGVTDEELYMKEEHADTWDEDFKDYQGNKTDVWDEEYEDPQDW